MASFVQELCRNYMQAAPAIEKLETRVAQHLLQFDEMALAARQARNAKRGQPDEDGFITVVHRSNNNNSSSSNNGKKKKRGELVDFYRFQMRDTKRAQLVDLRVKFQADKIRIQKLKDARKFKPY